MKAGFKTSRHKARCQTHARLRDLPAFFFLKTLTYNNMKTKALKIILIGVEGYELDRKDAEHIQGETFTSEALARTKLINKSFPIDTDVRILTPDEFKKTYSKKVVKAFDIALANEGKSQCYNLNEFMDEFNNQDFGGKTDKDWFTYIYVA
jgi:hypothetical protein